MPTFRIRLVSSCVIGLLAGCAGKQGGSHMPAAVAGPEPAPSSPPAASAISDNRTMPADFQSIIEAATQDAASRRNVDPGTIEVVRAERVTWSDGSLGCPSPGMQYTQALVPGYRIQLRAGGEILDYHAATNGHLALCPPGRAIDPVADDRI
jgi:hypothetical protein